MPMKSTVGKHIKNAMKICNIQLDAQIIEMLKRSIYYSTYQYPDENNPKIWKWECDWECQNTYLDCNKIYTTSSGKEVIFQNVIKTAIKYALVELNK